MKVEIGVAATESDRSGTIKLGEERAFSLGSLLVTPMTRQVEWPAENRTLEPRVMQVLVALGREPGTVVTRDLLIERCWDGRIVGENALQRVISLLRQLGADCDAFRIETITKVGYRLILNPADDGSITAPPPSAAKNRRVVLGGLAAAAAAGAAGLWLRPFAADRREARRLQSAGAEVQRRGGQANIRQAIRYYEEALRFDPQHAEIWSDLARARLSLVEYSPDYELHRHVTQVKAAARHALDIEPGNRSATVTLAIAEPPFRNWLAVGAGLRGALGRYPDEALLRERTAQFAAFTGQMHASIREYRLLVEREPLVPTYTISLASTLVQLGRFAEADPLIEHAGRLWPTDPQRWITHFNRLLLGGQPGAALEMTRRFAVGLGGTSPLPKEVAEAVARALTTGARLDILNAEAAIMRGRQVGSVASVIAAPYLCVLGVTELAWDVLLAYYLGPRDARTDQRQSPPRYAWRRTDILFGAHASPFRADARFGHLTRVLGLDDFWRRSGITPDFRQADANLASSASHQHLIRSGL